MAEYIEREAACKKCVRYGMGETLCADCVVKVAPAADVVPVSDLKEFAEDVLYQFGYDINHKGRLHLSSGGLSTLEWAFSILGWEDPKPFPEGECEWEGCHEYASCGANTPDGYKRVCGGHYETILAMREAEENARMDGDGNG